MYITITFSFFVLFGISQRKIRQQFGVSFTLKMYGELNSATKNLIGFFDHVQYTQGE